eukprot:g3529.t1
MRARGTKRFLKLNKRWQQKRLLSTTAGATTTRVQEIINGLSPFAFFTQLSNQHESVNLGQGFPSFKPPKFLTDASENIIHDEHPQHHTNQYSRPGGSLPFVESIAQLYSDSHNHDDSDTRPIGGFGRKLDPLTNICSFNGAQSGINLIMQTFVEPGQDVVAIEPYFEAYKRAAHLVRANTIGVPLQIKDDGSGYQLDMEMLERAINHETKLLILNTPHNPTGKVFSMKELEDIASICRKFPNLLVLSDEVYEYMVFDGKKHLRFALLPDMWERTISLYSAGKTFSATGWRIGYAIGPENLMQPLHLLQGAMSFCTATPLELAFGNAFKAAVENNYFDELRNMYQKKRDIMCDGLKKGGLNPIVPEGGYFVMASTKNVPVGSPDPENRPGPLDFHEERDYKVNEWLTKNCGMTGIPTCFFYNHPTRKLSDDWIRLAFCKTDSEIERAMQSLENAKL